MLLCARHGKLLLYQFQRRLRELSTASLASILFEEEHLEEVIKGSNSTLVKHATNLTDSVNAHLPSEHLEKVRPRTHFMHAAKFSDSADFLLRECTQLREDLSTCRQVHASLVNMGLDAHALVADHLVRAFALSGSLSEANMVFYKVMKRSLYTWNAIISAHTEFGDWEIALLMYHQLQQEGLIPDKCTFFAVLKACSAKLMIEQGRLVHEHIIQCALASVEVLAITLIDMYAKGGYLEDARRIFDDSSNQNVVSWNVMISRYAQAGECHHALKLFEKLPSKHVVPNRVTFACILKVCCELDARGHGMAIHREVVKLGLESDVYVGSTIVDMHTNFGSLESAYMLFLKLPNPNLVSWNVILKGYAQSKDRLVVLQLFERMQQQGVKPDNVTFLCIIKSCSGTGDIQLGNIVHGQIIEFGFESDLSVGNSVIDMYTKVGILEDGRHVFNNLSNRDVVSWNAMLAGYVEHATAFSALAFFEEMQRKGMKANEFTYACIVKVCCNTGSINLGKIIHEQILQARIELDLVLGNTLIDMYARCGSPEIAHIVLDDLPAPDVLSWNALISGYALCGNTCMMDWCLKDMQSQGLKPNGGTLTSILVACGHGGQIRVGTRYFYSMQKDYGITPNNEHFNSMADLLCRTGCLKEAEFLLQTMPLCIDNSGWTSLLAACRMYGNTKLGQDCPLKG